MSHTRGFGQQLAKSAEGRFAGKEPVYEGPDREGPIGRWRRLVKNMAPPDDATNEPSPAREVDVFGGLARVADVSIKRTVGPLGDLADVRVSPESKEIPIRRPALDLIAKRRSHMDVTYQVGTARRRGYKDRLTCYECHGGS